MAGDDEILERYGVRKLMTDRDALRAEVARLRAAVWGPVWSPGGGQYYICRICSGIDPERQPANHPWGFFTNIGHQGDCAFKESK